MKRKTFFIKKIFLLVLCCTILVSCNKADTVHSNVKKYNLPNALEAAQSGVIAANDSFQMSWDYDEKCFIITNLSNGKIWSSTPYSYYSTKTHENSYKDSGLYSTIKISYVDSVSGAETELNSFYDAEFIEAKPIKNGIQLVYYFNSVKISVPVEYILNDNGITAKVITKSITEAENKLYSVSVLPFFASCENNTDSYLFVPSGSGALIGVDSGKRDIRTYSERVFGNDATEQPMYKNENTQNIRMAAFGVSTSDGGILGVISEGAELASINALAGDEQYGYSCVYPSFVLRSKSTSVIKNSDNVTSSLISKYTADMVSINSVAVDYILLDKGQCDYNAMAKTYRGYIEEKYGSRQVDEPDVMLSIIGGVHEKKNFLGIPHSSTSVLTSFNETQQVLKEIKGKTSADIAVNMKGFGSNGINSSKVADGFKISKLYGSNKEKLQLLNWSEDNNITLCFNYNLVFYNKNGVGYSVNKSAKDANLSLAKHYKYNLITHSQDSDLGVDYLLSRYSLARIGAKLVSAAKDEELSAVALSELSSTIYSDCDDSLYYASAHMSDDVGRIIEQLRKNKFAVMGESANIYAAANMDYVINTPTVSSGFRCFDEEIPFYQMVLKGMVPISGAAINVAEDGKEEFLKSLSTGNALSFTLIKNEPKVSVLQENPQLSYSIYEGIKDEMIEMISDAKPFLDSVKGASIVNYNKQNNISCTQFDNGTVIYVNFGKESAHTPLGEVEAKSFIYK